MEKNDLLCFTFRFSSLTIVLLGISGTISNMIFWFPEKTNGRIVQAIVFLIISLIFGIIAIKIRPDKLNKQNLPSTAGESYE